jgi:hypothetical protein
LKGDTERTQKHSTTPTLSGEGEEKAAGKAGYPDDSRLAVLATEKPTVLRNLKSGGSMSVTVISPSWGPALQK